MKKYPNMEFASVSTLFLHLLLLMCSGLAREMHHHDYQSMKNQVLRLDSWDIHDDSDHVLGRSKNAVDHNDDDDDLSIYGNLKHHLHDEEDVGDDNFWIYRKHNQDHNHADPPTHMMKKSQDMVFFHLNDMKVGQQIPIYFRRKDDYPPLTSDVDLHFLSKEQADSIPFSSHQLPYLLKLLSVSPGSSLARAMENTLSHCEAEPILGESKTCVASFQSLLDFIHAVFGDHPYSTWFRVVTTRHLKSSPPATGDSPVVLFQNHTLVEIREEIWPAKMIACHEMPYAYPVLYCHGLEGGSKVLKVGLEGENGDLVEAVGVCHMDTSHWSPTHASFRVLGVEPGKSPVCHFFPEGNLVIFPAASSTPVDN